jgi:type II secretory pathway pseudopilin PulG
MILNKSQVWVETAIYTLIGLTIITIILAAILPRIEASKQRAVIEQMTQAIDQLTKKINEVEESPGNIRIVYLKFSQGKIEIDSINEKIIYTLEGARLKLSEPGQVIEENDMTLETKKLGDRYTIIISKNFNNINLTYSNNDLVKTIQPGATPYKIEIENIGDNGIDQKSHIDFNLL